LPPDNSWRFTALDPATGLYWPVVITEPHPQADASRLTVNPLLTPSHPAAPAWHCGRYGLPLDRVHLMGVLNVTPDSFSDGGRNVDPQAALAHAQQMIDEGATIIDVGGESTRPGAPAVTADDELARVLPVLQALRDLPVAVSIDTSEPRVMRAALDLGATIINDVRALRRPGALEVACASPDCGVVLMHMAGEPSTMQHDPRYGDVLHEVLRWLAQRRDVVLAAGVAPGRIALDPGFGFGKTQGHNRRLLAGLAQMQDLGHPVLVGLSRKSTLGELTGRPVTQRLPASIAAALIAAQSGARIVRVHDVGATRDALAVWEAVEADRRSTADDATTVESQERSG
jgi:dihydropteroate synthase